jgi:hypothetical protein
MKPPTKKELDDVIKNGNDSYNEAVNFSEFIIARAAQLGVTFEEIVTACGMMLSFIGVSKPDYAGLVVSTCKESIDEIKRHAKDDPKIQKSIKDFSQCIKVVRQAFENNELLDKEDDKK